MHQAQNYGPCCYACQGMGHIARMCPYVKEYDRAYSSIHSCTEHYYGGPPSYRQGLPRQYNGPPRHDSDYSSGCCSSFELGQGWPWLGRRQTRSQGRSRARGNGSAHVNLVSKTLPHMDRKISNRGFLRRLRSLKRRQTFSKKKTVQPMGLHLEKRNLVGRLMSFGIS